MWNPFKSFSRKSQPPTQRGNITLIKNFSQLLSLTDNYSQLAKAGYIENVIGSTCIRRTCEAMNSIPYKFKLNGKDIEFKDADKQVKSIIQAFKNPSTDMDRDLFIQSVQSDLFISGDCFLYPEEDAIGRVSGFKYLRSSKMSPFNSEDDRIHQYHYQSGSKRIVFERGWTKYDNEIVENPSTLEGRFNLINIRTFNPDSETEGMSMLKPCGLSIDGHNSALKWNNSVMSNGGRSQGVISFPESDYDEVQLKAIKKKLELETTGNKNGTWIAFNGDAKFEKFSFSAQEMDFIEGIVQRAIDICNALDYPPYLLGFTGATFDNQEEANIALFRNSAIPKTSRLYKTIASFLSLKYDIDFDIDICEEDIPVMMAVYEKKTDSTIKKFKANLMKVDEAREAIKLDPLKGVEGDLFYSDIARGQEQNSIELGT